MGFEADTGALVEFFRARLDEVEAAAKAAEPGPWHVESTMVIAASGRSTIPATAAYAPQDSDLAHIARHDPADALLDLEADRKLLGELDSAAGSGGGDWSEGEAGCADGMEAGLLLAVKIRAERFGAHPEYRPGWVSLS